MSLCRFPAALFAVLVLTACARPGGMAPPTEIPGISGLVTTRDPTSVYSGANGQPELCISGTTDSGPTGCLKPAIRLRGWPATAKRGVEYLVSGHYDGTAIRVHAVHRWDDAKDKRAPDWGDGQNDYRTRCHAPAGGWRVLRPALTTSGQIDELEFDAEKLPGYTAFWWDFSRTPVGGRENDPNFATANVMVDHDVAAARAALRKRWGGALCVTRSRHSRVEQQRIFGELDKLPGLIATSAKWDSVDCLVIADDGTLQAWADRRFGRGYVRVTPALSRLAR